MKVSKIMTHNPITVRPSTPVTDAQALMRKEKIHRLPVLDESNRLVGITAEKDILYASPSPASTLSVYEMSALLGKLTVDKVMTKKVLTVDEDTLIEDAARIMADNDIGGLPVMRKEKIVGIVTESDVFKLLIELFGTRKKGIRATLLIPEKKGEIAQMASAIADAGGNIISIGTFLGEDPSNAVCTLKLEGIDKEDLPAVVEPYVEEILDIREV
ncbi:MAG: CBS domain-containing protein [Spirochaetia bacterium]